MSKIYLTNFLKKPKLNFSSKEYEIIFDVPKEIFLKQIVFLYEHLLYPLYYHHKKIILIDYPFTSYHPSISPLLIHSNQEAIEMHLYLEAWTSLLKTNQDNNANLLYPLESLNKEQKKAVGKIEGPLCLLAPAGSGKTKTLVNRIFSLLNRGINSQKILVLVFNKKAEQELKSRLSTISVEIRTFHSFGNSLLKQYTDLEFYQEDPIELENTLLEQVITKHHHLVYGKSSDPLKLYREKLSQVKNNLLPMSQMELEINHQTLYFYPLFKDYLHLLQEEKLYDYDDMLYLSLCLLLKNGKLRDNLQAKYQYILVDEFQDLNNAQLLLLKIVALPQNNLFVVGDDDQMIYAFRGASVKPILDFKKNYKSAVCLQLTTNYRSKQRIVYHAKQFIDHNLERVTKEINSISKSSGEVEIMIGKDFKEEALHLIRWINKLPSTLTVAILYRYQVYGYILKFFFATEGLISKDDKALNHFSKLFILLEFFLEPFSLSLATKVAKFFSITLNQNQKNQSSVFQILDTVALFSKVAELLKKKDISFRYFCILLKINSSFFFDQEEITEDKLFSFLESLISHFGGVKKFYFAWKKKTVTEVRPIIFETIHKTKGNEFDAVGYFHMEYPSEIKCLEEERRISYVALTRAKSHLLITIDTYQFPRFYREYLQNSKLEVLSNDSLVKEYDNIVAGLKEKQSLLLLKLKDIFQMERRLEYEVQEEVATFYKIQRNNLYVLKQKIKKLKEEEFSYREEIWARSLLTSSSYDILSREKGEINHEKIN